MKVRLRADRLLVARGLFSSRAKAQAAIAAGLVTANAALVRKASDEIPVDAQLCARPAHPWVSRGGAKLAAALASFEFDPMGLVALDVGASTGGFTEVLLARGAAKVYAVDVGHGQLHASLRDNPRVVSFEGCDARSLTRTLIPEPVAAIVADVSFISLTKALLPALALAAPGAWLVALVKPQFEVGRGGIGKGGIVREPAARQQAVDTVTAWLSAQDSWRIAGVVPSPIKGGSGNEEYLLGALCDG